MKYVWVLIANDAQIANIFVDRITGLRAYKKLCAEKRQLNRNADEYELKKYTERYNDATHKRYDAIHRDYSTLTDYLKDCGREDWLYENEESLVDVFYRTTFTGYDFIELRKWEVL